MTEKLTKSESFEIEKLRLETNALEIRAKRLTDTLKIVTTGVVVTLLPAIISWQIQNQQVELERVKSEQSYLKDFSEQALQDDLAKRYNFADYLATVALSDQSRNRWTTYRDKIKQLFDDEDRLSRELIELRQVREDILIRKPVDETALATNAAETRAIEAQLAGLREQYKLLDAPVVAPSSLVFTEPFGGGTGIRYQARRLNLDNQGNAVLLPGGGRIEATLEIRHDCGECGIGHINQVIVGLAGEDRAQACVWIGQQSSGGWVQTRFSLKAPSTPGSYAVRTRYAQDNSCEKALGWWKTDRENGPTAESDIGAIVVTAPRRTE